MSEVFFGDPRLPLRFWEKVRVNEETGCWEWIAGRFEKGYGLFSVLVGEPRRTRLAHRAAFIATRYDPGELVCDHICRVRHCVNVNHLRAVTNKENILSGVGITAENARKTHCSQGHEYTPDNTVHTVRRSGKKLERTCLACSRGVRKRAHRSAPGTHGSAGMYRAGCRCRECKDQQRDRMRVYRAGRRQKINPSAGQAATLLAGA